MPTYDYGYHKISYRIMEQPNPHCTWCMFGVFLLYHLPAETVQSWQQVLLHYSFSYNFMICRSRNLLCPLLNWIFFCTPQPHRYDPNSALYNFIVFMKEGRGYYPDGKLAFKDYFLAKWSIGIMF